MPARPKTDALGLWKPTISVAYPRLLLEILEERGIAREAALRGTGLQNAQLDRAEANVLPVHWGRLVENAIRLSGDAGIGFELGLRLRASAHGFLGYATLTAPDLRSSLQVMIQYYRMRNRQYRLVYTESAEIVSLEVRETHAVAALQHPFMFEFMLVGFAQSLQALTGVTIAGVELQFRWPQPAYFRPYRARLPQVRFSCAANRIRIPAAALKLPLLLADETAHRQTLLQLEREYAGVHQEDGNVVERVRAELVLTRSGYPDLSTLSARLLLSSRSLRRRMLLAGVSYRLLLDEARYRDACRLLAASDLDLQTIAARLSFSDPANFTRAFRRWSGTTPSEFRHSGVLQTGA